MKFEHCSAVEVPMPPYREINGGSGSRPFYPINPRFCLQDTAEVSRGGSEVRGNLGNLACHSYT